MNRRLWSGSGVWARSVALLTAVVATAAALGAWKYADVREAAAAAARVPEPVETVSAATARVREHRQTATSIGTVRALRSITVRNEVPGTVRRVALVPGEVVEAGAVLVALDVAVEQAELAALQAQAELARTLLERTARMAERQAVSAIELDNARAERDVALAQVARLRALIARKSIRAPFRARVGIADVHVGQFLDAGTQLTTLQGVDDAAHVDFAVAQSVAAGLREGEPVRLLAADAAAPVVARIVAVDARVDSTTRNATVRARVERAARAPAPGASVRIEVPVGPPRTAVVVPVSALRKGPAGDHVFVLARSGDGDDRARLRAVRAGPVLGDEVVILDGLRAGERVAVSGSFKLRDSSRVTVARDPSAAGGLAGAP